MLQRIEGVSTMSVLETFRQPALHKDTIYIRVAIGGGSIVVSPPHLKVKKGWEGLIIWTLDDGLTRSTHSESRSGAALLRSG
jgi:hypothetical protein